METNTGKTGGHYVNVIIQGDISNGCGNESQKEKLSFENKLLKLKVNHYRKMVKILNGTIEAYKMVNSPKK